jgi:hypothetical protein
MVAMIAEPLSLVASVSSEPIVVLSPVFHLLLLLSYLPAQSAPEQTNDSILYGKPRLANRLDR